MMQRTVQVAGVGVQTWMLRRLGGLAYRRKNLGEASHLATGEYGELEGLLYLREVGYTIVARRWKSARVWGDVDLIGWDGACLCFVEVKTRSSRDVAVAEAAVDEEKQRMLQKMARAYLRGFTETLRGTVAVRFDVLSVYLLPSGTEFELYRDAFGWR